VNCRECGEFLADYLAGELATEVHATFERHLAKCRTCRIYLEQYRTTIRLGKDACAADAPALPEDLIQAILEARRSY
jgi:predicted anti-sigma-YlaC factor YlaD